MTKNSLDHNLSLFLCLATQPFIFFNLHSPEIIFASFLVFCAIAILSRHTRLSLIVILFLAVLVFKSALQMPSSNYLNSINTLRGEHHSLEVGRVFHNKIDLTTYVLRDGVTFLSPSFYFGRGSYSKLDHYLPIPFLVPWFAIIGLFALAQLSSREIVKFVISATLFTFLFMLLSASSKIIAIAGFCFCLLNSIASFLKKEKEIYLKLLVLINILYLVSIWLIYKPT